MCVHIDGTLYAKNEMKAYKVVRVTDRGELVSWLEPGERTPQVFPGLYNHLTGTGNPILYRAGRLIEDTSGVGYYLYQHMNEAISVLREHNTLTSSFKTRLALVEVSIPEGYAVFTGTDYSRRTALIASAIKVIRVIPWEYGQ